MQSARFVFCLAVRGVCVGAQASQPHTPPACCICLPGRQARLSDCTDDEPRQSDVRRRALCQRLDLSQTTFAHVESRIYMTTRPDTHSSQPTFI